MGRAIESEGGMRGPSGINATWTPMRIERLTFLWNADVKIRDIAELLCVNRNQIIGKAHRMHLKRRDGPANIVRTAKPPKPKVKLSVINGMKGAAATSAKSFPTKAPTRLAPRLGKIAACRWPEGDPKHSDFHFCEARTEPGRPYCHAHCMRAYQVTQEPQLMAAE